jgi:predicted XRE-type DNA-binding protein
MRPVMLQVVVYLTDNNMSQNCTQPVLKVSCLFRSRSSSMDHKGKRAFTAIQLRTFAVRDFHGEFNAEQKAEHYY